MDDLPQGPPTPESESWQRVTDLLGAALERPPDERPAFLERACGPDEDLRAQVESMLRADARAGDRSFMAQPLFSLRGELDEDPQADSQEERQRIGPYRLTRELGRGGMGSVFLAQRIEGGFEQQVAIKLLKRGLDSDEIVSRFRVEQQILAGLNHPNIARLLDGGTTDDDRPYVVMEHVEGERIDAYCASRQLPLEDRIALIRSLCDAVQYAHQNLVVHRDLKPSNILVTAEGVPKLLDFGIAKLLEDGKHNAGEHSATRTGLLMPMTPQYASPEQVRGGAITTATDVYGLGLLLYELLAGAPPYRTEELSPTELEQAVCVAPPTRPSSASRAMPEEDEATLPVARHLVGDLDNITLRALAKEPERRYASAEQLGDDLRRYLEDEPVRARADSFLYRAKKFARRNALGVSLGSAFALALALFAIVMAAQRSAIARQNEEILRQSAIIADEGDRAQEVTRFLIDILQVPDPTHGTGETLTVREALDAAADSLRTTLHDRLPTRAALLDIVGRVYTNLELFDRAEPLLEEALAIRRSQGGEADPLVAASLHNLASLRARQGNPSDAEALRRQAVDLQRRTFPEGHPELALGLNNLASLLRRRRELDEAEALAREAMAMQERLLGPEHMDLARTLNTLATLARYRGERGASEELYRRSVAIRRALSGGDDAGLARTLNNLAVLLVDRGADKEAIQLHEEALAMRRRLYAGDHSDRLTSLNNLAVAEIFDGQAEQALERLDQALAMDERLDHGKCRHGAVLRKNRALAFEALGRFEVCAREAAEARSLFGESGAGAAEAAHLEAACRAMGGGSADFEAALDSSLGRLREEVGEGAWQIRAARARTTRVHEANGRAKKAASPREPSPS